MHGMPPLPPLTHELEPAMTNKTVCADTWLSANAEPGMAVSLIFNH